MTDGEIIDALLKCTMKYGKKSQTHIAIEEASELIQALCKLERPDASDALDNVTEELADMQIMLIQMIMIYSDKDIIRNEIENKIRRQKERMTNEPEVIKTENR